MSQSSSSVARSVWYGHVVRVVCDVCLVQCRPHSSQRSSGGARRQASRVASFIPPKALTRLVALLTPRPADGIKGVAVGFFSRRCASSRGLMPTPSRYGRLLTWLSASWTPAVAIG